MTAWVRLARAWEQAGLECPPDAHAWGDSRDPLFTSVRYWPRYGVFAIGWDGESWRHADRLAMRDLFILGAPINGGGGEADLTAEPWFGGKPGARHGPPEDEEVLRRARLLFGC